MRLALLLRELQEIERPLDVDVVRRHRRELGPCGQQGRQVEHEIDLELGQHPIEHARVANRSGELARDQRCKRRVERAHVERDDERTRRGQPRHETVADLAARARDQDGWLPHVCDRLGDFATAILAECAT